MRLYLVFRNDSISISHDRKIKMNTKSCPNCGFDLPLDARQCSSCGTIFFDTGKFGERGITRTRAILTAVILLIFPLCCLGSVGYRLVTGAPADFGFVLPGEEEDESESSDGLIGNFMDRIFGGEEVTIADVIEEAIPSLTNQVDQEIAEAPVPSETTEPMDVDVEAVDTPETEQSIRLPDIPELECVPRDTDRQVAEVIQVIDGDEIRVRVGEEEFVVRYIGILAPEISDPYGPEASNENIYQVFSKEVILVRDETDQDTEGRLLRYVLLGDRMINHYLVSKGLAQAENMAPDTACSDLLQRAEADAQQGELGMWAGTPEPTKTFAPLWTETAEPTEKSSKRGKANCDCDGPDLNCGDFPNDTEAQLCYLKCLITHGDVFDLDTNGNGVACDE